MNEENEQIELVEDAENSSETSQDLTPDEAAASLAFSNMMQEQTMMPQVMPEEGMGDEESQPEAVEEQPEPQPSAEETPDRDLTSEFDEFKGEVKGIIETEMGSLKDMIQNAINEEE